MLSLLSTNKSKHLVGRLNQTLKTTNKGVVMSDSPCEGLRPETHHITHLQQAPKQLYCKLGTDNQPQPPALCWANSRGSLPQCCSPVTRARGCGLIPHTAWIQSETLLASLGTKDPRPALLTNSVVRHFKLLMVSSHKGLELNH